MQLVGILGVVRGGYSSIWLKVGSCVLIGGRRALRQDRVPNFNQGVASIPCHAMYMVYHAKMYQRPPHHTMPAPRVPTFNQGVAFCILQPYQSYQIWSRTSCCTVRKVVLNAFLQWSNDFTLYPIARSKQNSKNIPFLAQVQ